MLQIILTNELYFIFSILLLFIFCIYYGLFNNGYLYQIQNQIVINSIIFLSYYVLILLIGINNIKYSFYNITYSYSYSFFLQVIITILTILILLISTAFIRMERINAPELYLLLLIAVLGFLFIVEFVDILGIYLSIELVSLSFYILTAFNKHNIYSSEAALKYFILGSISSNFILFGFSYLYISTGLTNIIEISKLLIIYLVEFTDILYFFHEQIFLSNIIFSLFFVFVGLLFKIYAAPFHLWIPDIYNNSPLIITAFFSTLPLIPFISILLHFTFYFNILGSFLSYFFFFFAFCSIVFGAIGALFQSKIKRLLAYSAITHVGYFLIFIYLLLKVNEINIYLIQLFFTYILLYLITNIGIFGILISLYSYANSVYLNEVFDFSKLSRSNWLLCFILMVFFFSISGLPPLSGFVGKLLLFSSILSFGDKIFLFLTIMFFAVVSCFYYVRIIKILYFNNYIDWHFLPNIQYLCSVVISLVFIFVLHFFFFSDFLNIITLYLSLNFLQ